jgi:RHS repeat-associated protein
MSRATQINLSENKPLTENRDFSGMPSDFGSGTTGSYIYSVYADYIPVAIEGNTTVYSSSDTSANRTAVPYTMTEDGVINSISIYHNGVCRGLPARVFVGKMLRMVPQGMARLKSQRPTTPKAVNSTAGWQTVELTQSIQVEAGQTIWLAWVFESNPGTRYTSGSPSKAVSSQYWAGQMPQEFGSSSSSSYIYSICANYSPAQAHAELTLIGNPYMFTAREYDIETGLYYYRARYYNPYIGRFLQTDPAYQGMNWYAYCGNNPLNCTDPMGLVSSMHYPSAIYETIAISGLDNAIYIYGVETTTQAIMWSSGVTIAVNAALWGSIYNSLISGPCVPGPCVPGPCNVETRLSHSFEEIVNNKDLFETWANKKSYPQDRPYNALEALYIYYRFQDWKGGPPEIDPPEGGWFWHMHGPGHGPHIPISLEAYELLKKLFSK